jgi:SHS2 domain-containing protein
MKIQINAMDSKTLLNKLLNQVLEFTYAQHAIFCTMYIEELTERKLNAQLFGNWFDIFDNKLKFVSKNDIFLRENKDEDNTFISSISFECE